MFLPGGAILCVTLSAPGILMDRPAPTRSYERSDRHPVRVLADASLSLFLSLSLCGCNCWDRPAEMDLRHAMFWEISFTAFLAEGEE